MHWWILLPMNPCMLKFEELLGNSINLGVCGHTLLCTKVSPLAREKVQYFARPTKTLEQSWIDDTDQFRWHEQQLVWDCVRQFRPKDNRMAVYWPCLISSCWIIFLSLFVTSKMHPRSLCKYLEGKCEIYYLFHWISDLILGILSHWH